ncbi:hypothetical protein CPB84DRAFT_557604 [Gymnopilus junonius]|uniref:F-box domain-containing protein n=1 Tax=Gymnopilus junonius TaxID=109634 RepID=A0A9P5TGK0_GYMJU|nr:hypothetical protein CPB84DRAFT_557604 [Gymnopilus junonius]
MAHINKLPVELLSEIFKESMVFSEIFVGAYSCNYTRNEAPVSLIHVCKRWRAIALSLSPLWGSHRCPDFIEKPSLESVDYWLQISKRAPLKLIVYTPMWMDDSDTDPPLWPKVLQVYAKHIHRWHTLCVRGDTLLVQKLTSVLCTADSTPPLEDLRVELLRRIPTSVMNDFASSINSLKTLRRLHWRDGYGPEGVNIDNLPWGQLTNISFAAKVTPEQVLARLSRCESANIVKFERQNIGPPSYLTLSTFNHPHMTLSHLTSLTLHISADPLNILRFFTIPSLRYLKIAVLERRFDYLEDLLLRSACPLDVLVVEDTRNSSLEQIMLFFQCRFLCRIPNVKYFCNWVGSDFMMRKMEKLHNPATIPMPSLLSWADSTLGREVIGWSTTPTEEVIGRYENGKYVGCKAYDDRHYKLYT